MNGERHRAAGSCNRNFPMRSTDWAEGVGEWALITLGLVGVVLSLVVGFGTYGSTLEQSRAEAAGRSQVQAVVTKDPMGVPDPEGRGSYLVTATVRWTGTGGMERTGETQVPVGHVAGDAVPVWMDKKGQLVPAPTSTGDAYIVAFFAAGLTLAGAAGVLALLHSGMRRWVLRANCAGWEREWAAIEPSWSGRSDKHEDH